MHFSINHAIDLLRRTPTVLDSMLRDLGADWVEANEGPETFSPFDVLGHLIHGERTDWVPRMEIILEHGTARPFDPYDRFAQVRESKGKTLDELLDEFRRLREANVDALRERSLAPDQLDLEGAHPDLGAVTLRQLLAAWVVHDLGHVAQVSRVLAKQWRDYVGPWVAYLPVLSDRPKPAS